MIRRIRTADDLTWLLAHTQAFPGGQITTLSLQKQRVFDEASGREITAGTAITTTIRYELAVRGIEGLYSVSRVAKLAMKGVTDFSIFEQEGADFSEIGLLHTEMSGGRLRFSVDPHGELYVICDEAELEEVSRPGTVRPLLTGISEWTFQAETGTLPTIDWFLSHLDRMGCPCAWRTTKPTGPAHPALRWAGLLLPASSKGLPRSAGVSIQTYGAVWTDTVLWNYATRLRSSRGSAWSPLNGVLADLIVHEFSGNMFGLVYDVMARDEWLGGDKTGREAVTGPGQSVRRTADSVLRLTHSTKCENFIGFILFLRRGTLFLSEHAYRAKICR